MVRGSLILRIYFSFKIFKFLLVQIYIFIWRFLYALIFTMLSPVFFWILSLFILGSKYVKVYFRFLIFIFMVKIVFISMYFLILFFLILKFILVSKCSRNLTFSVFESMLILGYSSKFLIFFFYKF